MLRKLTNTAARINGEAPAPVPGDNTQARMNKIANAVQRIQFVIPECFYRESRIQKISSLWIPAFAGMTIYSGL
jgi:hypothetical protein